MAPQRKVQSEIKDYFFTGFYASMTLEAANIMGSWYLGINDVNYLWPWVVGYGYVAWRRFLGNAPTKAVIAFSSTAAHFKRDPDIDTFIMKYRERPVGRHELTFRGYGLPVPIPESKFARFVKMAWRRQMNAVYGSRLNMMWQTEFTGQPRLKRLTANQVLSARHYTRNAQPRFLESEYVSCVMILEKCKLLDNRKQGRAGLLLYEPELTVNIALNTWFPPPKEKRRNILGFSRAS